MKKVAATILAFVYLATSSGAIINSHYCMGKMYSVDFSNENKCSKCGMKHEKGCCENKAKVLKAQDAHPFVNCETSLPSNYVLIYTTYNIYSTTFPSLTSAFATHNNSPPHSGTSLSVLYCIFRL